MALAFAAVYLLWGSTYLGMKVAIQSFPPLLVGGMRFSAAGLTLLLAQALLGKVEPAWLRSPRYWRSALLCGGLMLLVANGLLAASLHRVGTGTAALGVALTPVWLVLFDRWQTRRGGYPTPPERGELPAAGFRVSWIDARGTLLPSGMGSGPTTPQPGFRLLGAVVEGEGGPWFFKVTGPEATLGPEREAFFGLLRGVRRP